MNREIFEMHWQYYLSIERMLSKTNQYVTHSIKNKAVYSDEFASIILLSCSELDSLFKQLCIVRGVKSKSEYFQMRDYAPLIRELFSDDFGVSPSMSTWRKDGIIAFPFNKIDVSIQYANLEWWKDYQHNKT